MVGFEISFCSKIRAEEAEKANEREREERVRSALREEFNTALQAQAEDHDKALEKGTVRYRTGIIII